MNDLRNTILQTTYDQTLKLLDPNSSEFKKQYPFAEKQYPLDAEEREVVSGVLPVLQYVQMGSCDIKDVETISLTPAIYIANGTESLEIPHGSAAGRRFGIESGYVGESFPIVIRLVVNQGLYPKYEDANPVIIARVREQLDYFLDETHFRGLSAQRIGYQFPSVAITAGITASYTLEGIATPWEVYDFRLEVIFKRQKSRFDEY